jgi:hypothetical protein
MTGSTKATSGKGDGPPDTKDQTAFEAWLLKQPREWSVTIAARTTLRVVPLLSGAKNFPVVVLTVFRATAIARFAAKYPNHAIKAVSLQAGRAGADAAVADEAVAGAGRAAAKAVRAIYAAATHAAYAASDADLARTNPAYRYNKAYAAAGHAAIAAANTAKAAAGHAAVYAAVKHDAQRLHDGILSAEQLARDQLWPISAPDEFIKEWQRLRTNLDALGQRWRTWTGWYENIAFDKSHRGVTEAEDAAFTDVPGELPWRYGAEAVNTEIARRLAELRVSKIPDQSPAPVRVEERDGKVAKASDRDSALSASERDFKAWRDPVVDHINELTAFDFAEGTNHGRVRDRLMALGKLLLGEIAEVKERQFRIGYEIERFEGLTAAYRTGGEDMPVLNAAQFEDLDRLRVALRRGVEKLERWSEFRKQANESTTGEADADRETVADTMDEMAEVMEQRPQYFHPELPTSFRFLAEAVRDRSGATRTIVFGAVKSAENVVSFLGQRALGIGKKSVEAVEAHISKAIAASLIAALSKAALGLSGALPQGWTWLKPLLAALGVGG